MEYWTAFVLGLVGSLHCAGMCGPLALALPSSAKSYSSFVLGRVVYNSGRIVMYCFLGLVFGIIGRTLWLAGLQRWVSIALGGALLLGLLTSRRLAVSKPLLALVEAVKSRMATQLRRRSFLSLGLLGLLNGLLPCGLVYVACAGAVSTGGILAATRYMAAFGAGTVPLTLTISLAGKLVPFSLRLRLSKAIPVSVCLLAALLILRGMSLGIPYLSPDLTAANPSCCHQ
jgi:sulfite exporter TauE/SafE